MFLREEHFPARTMLRLPHTHPTFQGPTRLRPVLTWLLTLQPQQQRLGLQTRLTNQQLFQTRPHTLQRIGTRPPVMRTPGLTGELFTATILASGFAIHP
jgi:hypothetical protein